MIGINVFTTRARPSTAAPVAFRFTPKGKDAHFQIDDVYVDPVRTRPLKRRPRRPGEREMLTRGVRDRVRVAGDDRVEDRPVALRHGDERVVLLGEPGEPQVVEHLVDDVDDPRVAGAGQQAEVERAVEVEERAACRGCGRRRCPRRRCPADASASSASSAPASRASIGTSTQRAQLERRVEVGRGVLDDPEPAVADLLDHARGW